MIRHIIALCDLVGVYCISQCRRYTPISALRAGYKRLYKEGKRKTILVGNKWKKIKYKGYQMRSSWEVVFAKWLNKNKLEWKYEPKIFQCKTIKYIPDFYVKDLQEAIKKII